jgi:hypothetical protein
MENKYISEIKKAEELSARVIESLNSLEFDREDGLIEEYCEHTKAVKDVDLNKMWFRFVIKQNRRAIIMSASAAVVLLLLSLLIFLPSDKFAEEGIYALREQITPAKGVVTLRLASGETIAIDSLKTTDNLISGVEINTVSEEISYEIFGVSTSDSRSAGIEDKTTVDKKEGIEYNELYIPKGRSYSLILSDGSRVWLNAESSIRYPVKFAKNERRVFIKGEAFFDVKHNPESLFIAETDDYKVKVLGTKFNVNSYSDESVVATTLVSGSVSVTNDDANEFVITPGEQFRYNRESRNIEMIKVDVDIYTSWTENKLRLDQMTLEDVFKILQRRYDIDVFYSNEEVKYEKFNGKVPLNDNLNIILDLISTVSNIEFQIEKKLIVIRYKD